MAIEITDAQIAAIASPVRPKLGAHQVAAALTVAFNEWEIDTPRRAAAAIAQLAHESDCFCTTREYADGSAYEGRKDLGNTEPGDGRRFRGRGLIQITGRSNYAAAGQAFGLDLVAHPEQLEDLANAAIVSAWWWKEHGLNELADLGEGMAAYRGRAMPAFEAITRIINGGTTHLDQRQALWLRARRVMGA